MATYEELIAAAQKAESEGRNDAARTLATKAFELRTGASQSTAVEEPETSQTQIGSIARGAGAGLTDIAQGIGELGAAALDYTGITDDASRPTSEFFEGVKDALGLRPETSAGKITEALVNYGSLAIPVAGWIGAAAKGANIVRAGVTVPKAATAFQRSAQAFGGTGIGRALTGTRAARAGSTALGTGLADVLVAPSTGVTLADSWDALPEYLRTEDEEGLVGRELAATRLANKFRIGLEGAGFSLGLEAALPVIGATVRAGAQVPGVPTVAGVISNGLDALGNRLGNVGFLRRNFTSAGATPKEIFDSLQAAQNIPEAQQLFASKALSDYDKAIHKTVGSQKLFGRGKAAVQQAYEKTTDFLTGRISAADFAKQYGDEVLEAAQGMRSTIDDLSTQFEQSVVNAPNLSQVQKSQLLQEFKDNQGSYLRRVYELHLQPEKFKGLNIREMPEYEGARNQVADFLMARDPQLAADPVAATQKASFVIDEIFGESIIQAGLKPEAFVNQQMKAAQAGAKQIQGRVPLYKLASGMLTERKEMLDSAPLLRRMMGEVRDPRTLFLRTVDDMSKSMVTQRLYDDIASRGIETFDSAIAQMNAGGRPFVIDGSTVSDDMAKMLESTGYVKLGEVDPNNAFGGKFGSLSGNYVPAEIYNSLTTPLKNYSYVQDALAIALQAKGMSQSANTVLNPLTQIRNFLSNIFVVGANGLWGRNMDIFESADVLLANALDNPQQFKVLKAIADEGAIGQNIQLNEMTKLLQEQVEGGLSSMLRKGGSWLKSSKLGAPVRAMETTYRIGDDYWKVVGVLGEKARYSAALRKAGLDLDALDPAIQAALVNGGIARRADSIAGTDFSDLLAIDIVRNTMPTYSMVPEAIKNIRKVPFVGNFMSWPAEIMRTSVNIVDRGLKELSFKASDDLINAMARQIAGTGAATVSPRALAQATKQARQLERQIRAIGAQRLSGYTTMAFTAPSGIVNASHTILGITPEQEELLARNKAPYQEGNKLMYITPFDKNGNAEAVDLSTMLPYEFMLAPARAALDTYRLQGEIRPDQAGVIMQGAWEAFSKFVEPFAGEALAYERIVDATTRGGQTADGAKIYEAAESTGDKIGKSLFHVAGAFVPGIVNNFLSIRRGEMEPGRITRAVTGTPSAQGDPYSVAEEVGTMLTGLRPLRVNTSRSLLYAGAEYSDLRTSAARIFTSKADDNDVTDQDIVDAYAKANEARRAQAAQLYGKVQASIDAGMSVVEVRRALKETGLSDKEVTDILANRFTPIKPSRDLIREVMRESMGASPDAFAVNRIVQALPIGELMSMYAGYMGGEIVPTTQPDETPLLERAKRGFESVQQGASGLIDTVKEKGAALAAPVIGSMPASAAPQPPRAPARNVPPSPALLGSDPISQARNAEIAQRLSNQ